MTLPYSRLCERQAPGAIITMTAATTEKAANVIVAVAAVGAAIMVIRTPALRRLAWNLARTAVTVSVPGWFGREIQQAWVASGRRD